MSETYLVTAKTVEEAIAIANREYADENHEVSYEILEMPKKGFLGIGARDAKIKITVTKSVSADIGSLVADIRGMKVLTDRGDTEDKKQKPQKNNNQNLNQKNQQNQQKKNPDQKNQDKKNPEKTQQKPQNNQKKAEKPEVKAEKIEKKVENKVEKTEKIDKIDKIDKIEKTEKVEKTEKTEYKSSLHNQAKPNRHKQIKHNPSADADINPTGVTGSGPIGVSSFVTKSDDSFGSETKSSASRMSNDIRKNKNAPKKIEAVSPVATAAPKAEEAKQAENDENVLSAAVDAAISEMVADLPAAPEEKIKRECVTPAEMEFALEFANTLLANMQLGATAEAVECPEGEEVISTETANVYPKINIVGDDTGILIGHHGETLDAIQYLVNLSAMRKSKQSDGDYIKIVVDIENYRQKREETLRALARRMAARAVKYKRNVFFEPMNAYERRIIHSELQNYADVSTHSVGSDRDRKIIITYEGADKQPDRRRRRSSGENRGAKAEGAQITEKTNDKPKKSSSRGERGSKKIRKMPIENLHDFLPTGENEPEEKPQIED